VDADKASGPRVPGVKNLTLFRICGGAVRGVVGIEGGVVSGC
jgi:hypothetical protein